MAEHRFRTLSVPLCPSPAGDKRNSSFQCSLIYFRHELERNVGINEVDIRLSINAQGSAAFWKLLRAKNLRQLTLRTNLPDAIFDHVQGAIFADNQVCDVYL